MSAIASVSNSCLAWVPASCGEPVEHIVEAGTAASDGASLWVARGETQDGEMTPGKLHAGHAYAHLQIGGVEVHHEEYEVLTNPGGVELAWIAASGGAVPAGAVQGGTCTLGQPIFLARALHEDSGDVVPGKVVPRMRKMYIPWGGKEIALDDYEVMCVKSVSVALRDE